MPAHPYTTTLEERFHGKLLIGSHTPDGEACALEVASIARGLTWTDNPETVGLPDLRPLNDAPWSSDAERTKNLVPVVLAYWDWGEWSDAKRREIMTRVAEQTIRQVLPIALRAAGLEAEAKRCGAEGSESAAARAADAAESAAWSVARAAESAARAADDQVLILACRIWIEAAEGVK
jgi:hypothetical protein